MEEQHGDHAQNGTIRVVWIGAEGWPLLLVFYYQATAIDVHSSNDQISYSLV